MLRCEACGGPYVKDERVQIDPKTGKPPENALNQGCAQAGLLFAVGLIGFIVVGIALAIAGAANNPVAVLIAGVVALLIGVVWPIGLLVNASKLSAQNARLPWVHQCKCGVCGHSWFWEERIS